MAPTDPEYRVRILFLSRWYPYPPDNGSKIRVHGLLRGLCERHEVTLLSFRDPADTPQAPPPGGPAEISVSDYREFRRGSGPALAGFFSPTPRHLIDTRSREMERLITTTLGRSRYDLVIASELAMAAYHHVFEGIPAIFEDVEMGFFWPGNDSSRRLTRFRRQITWAKHRRYIARLVKSFACCTVVSEHERELLMRAAPGYSAVHVVPNSVDTAGEPVFTRDPNALIFTGSLRYGPNRDAVEWFVRDIFPAVRVRMPDARLTVTGEPGPTRFDRSLGVSLVGYVPDVRSLISKSSVSLAPIRTGAGTRIKILEAMAARTPVVATTKAAEGLEVRHEEHLLIADTPGAFAAAVCRLLGDPAAAAGMAERAWRLCRDHYDTRAVALRLVQLAEAAAVA